MLLFYRHPYVRLADSFVGTGLPGPALGYWLQLSGWGVPRWSQYIVLYCTPGPQHFSSPFRDGAVGFIQPFPCYNSSHCTPLSSLTNNVYNILHNHHQLPCYKTCSQYQLQKLLLLSNKIMDIWRKPFTINQIKLCCDQSNKDRMPFTKNIIWYVYYYFGLVD